MTKYAYAHTRTMCVGDISQVYVDLLVRLNPYQILRCRGACINGSPLWDSAARFHDFGMGVLGASQIWSILGAYIVRIPISGEACALAPQRALRFSMSCSKMSHSLLRRPASKKYLFCQGTTTTNLIAEESRSLLVSADA